MWCVLQFFTASFWTHSDRCVSAVHSCGDCVCERKMIFKKNLLLPVFGGVGTFLKSLEGVCVLCLLDYFKKANSWADILVGKSERLPLCTISLIVQSKKEMVKSVSTFCEFCFLLYQEAWESFSVICLYVAITWKCLAVTWKMLTQE